MKKSKNECDLNSCFLCELSLKEWLPAIEANKQTIHVKKGEVIFKEGDAVKGIYFIYKGTVKIHKKWGDDKELIIRIANDGNIFGHRGLGSNIISPITATALASTTYCFIDLEFFQSTVKVNHEFLYQLMMFFADELRESEKRMRNLAHMSVKARVCEALLQLKKKFGVNEEGFIGFSLSRQDLSSFVGATYETVFRIINELTEEKVITTLGKDIKIINEAMLANIINKQNT